MTGAKYAGREIYYRHFFLARNIASNIMRASAFSSDRENRLSGSSSGGGAGITAGDGRSAFRHVRSSSFLSGNRKRV